MNKMATSSLDDSVQATSKAGDVSIARQRRRRTTRKSGTKTLNHTELQNGGTKSITPTQSSENLLSDSVQTPTRTVNDNGGSVDSSGTARQRRTQRKRESIRSKVVTSSERTVASFTPHPELEDSTAGVASLLEKNLNQTDELRIERVRQDANDEVIVNPTTASPIHQISEAEPGSQLSQEVNEQGDPLINGETRTSAYIMTNYY